MNIDGLEFSFTVELDGGQHNQVDSKESYKARSEYLRTQGIGVMRF